MHEATTTPTLTSDTPEDLAAAARRAEAWLGEPFLAPGEEPEVAPAVVEEITFRHLTS